MADPPETATAFLAGVYRWLAKLACRFAARHDLDADEVLSVAALAVLQQHHSYDASLSRPTTWSKHVFQSAALKHLHRERTQRQRYRPHSFESDRLTVLSGRRTAPALTAADRAKVSAAVARLPAKQRAAVLARHWQDETQAEIAERSGTSRQAVSALERSAYKRLALALYFLQ